MAATNQQVQTFSDFRVRPRCATIALLVQQMQNDMANIGDVYANVSGASTWVDGRSDGVPHLATPGDIVNWNGFVTRLLQVITGSIGTDSATALSLVQGIQGQWPIIQELPINPVPNA